MDGSLFWKDDETFQSRLPSGLEEAIGAFVRRVGFGGKCPAASGLRVSALFLFYCVLFSTLLRAVIWGLEGGS